MSGPTLPAATAQFVNKDGTPTKAFYNWLRTLSGPGLQYLGTVSAASNVIQDTTILAANNANFRSFLLVAKNIIASAASVIGVQWHSGGSFQASSYLSSLVGTDGTAFSETSTAYNYWGFSDTTDPGMSGTLVVSNLASTSLKKQALMTSSSVDPAGTLSTSNSSGFWNGGNGAIDGFQVIADSGNITSGSIDIYGIL